MLWSSAAPALPSIREPAGSSTVTARDPELPRIRLGSAVAIRRTPSRNSISVCSAAFTSRFFEADAGRTSTVASERSEAMNRTLPAGMFRKTVIGPVVSNFCMMFSLMRCLAGPVRPALTHPNIGVRPDAALTSP